MRYAMIMAGGSGVRLWPMSRARQPKQLIPFLQGRSLLQVAAARLEGPGAGRAPFCVRRRTAAGDHPGGPARLDRRAVSG